MDDQISKHAIERAADPEIIEILHEVCRATGMGFAAVARVTETRWIACQVVDDIDFGLLPGGELDIKTTICDEVRRDGRHVIIDHVDLDDQWRTHPVPIIYGFKSYASLPITLDGGEFFGTLCAIDQRPNKISTPEIVAKLKTLALRVGQILSAK